jgi:hypothetical protein
MDESPSEFYDRVGIDGAKWAAEFRKTAIRLGYSDMDEGWLIGWFANAMMVMHDHCRPECATRVLPDGSAFCVM